MKTRHPIRSLLLGALFSAACLASTSASNLIVNWGGSYLANGTASEYTKRGATSINQETKKGVLYGYSDTTPLLGPTATYSGTSDTFYGALHLTSPINQSGSQIRVRSTGNASEDWSGNNRLYIQTPSTTSSSSSPALAQGMIFWKKEDFLSGESSEPLSLNSLDEFVLNASYGRVSQSTLRFVVQSDGVWYLSQKSLTTGSKLAVPLGVLTLNNPADSLWASWDIQDSATSLLNPAPTNFDIVGNTLNNITAVGFYFEGSYTLSNSAMFGFEQFSVTSIPEPSTAAFLGGSALLLVGGLAIKRGRKK